MFGINIETLGDIDQKDYTLEDFEGGVPRWCSGCGDFAILTATQRLCREEQLPPEKTVFVSGIGCSSRFPHYMKTYGFHGLHGRALPIAEGVKVRRPDLNVFVNMGDGDCCSIGTAHWIHAIRYNMNLVAMLHDNGIYGLTKKQASPTSPKGLKSNTTPDGTWSEPLNPLSTTLGVQNVSFVAQTVDWIPDLVYNIIRMAFRHRGFSFVRILQRCPHFTAAMFDPLMNDPKKLLLLTHQNGIEVSDALAKVYTNREEHNPEDIAKARAYADRQDVLPVGILYRNENITCYEDVKKSDRFYTPELKKTALEKEFDKYSVKSNIRKGSSIENGR